MKLILALLLIAVLGVAFTATALLYTTGSLRVLLTTIGLLAPAAVASYILRKDAFKRRD